MNTVEAYIRLSGTISVIETKHRINPLHPTSVVVTH